MSYNIEITPQAEEDLRRLPGLIQKAALHHLIEFAKNPGVAGSRSAPSLYTPGQLIEFQLEHDQMTCWVGMVFRYTQDERTLVIERVYVEFV